MCEKCTYKTHYSCVCKIVLFLIPSYRRLFSDFISEAEWKDIIAESDPFFQPPHGEQLGLQTVHIFGLSNVLRRPIILLDSLEGIQSLGEHSGRKIYV